MSERTGQEGNAKKADEGADEPQENQRTDPELSIRKKEEDDITKKCPNTDDPSVTVPTLPTPSPSLSDVNMNELAEMAHSTSTVTRFSAVHEIRKRLCVEVNPPISEVISTGAVPTFVSYLDKVNEPQLQHESAWLLTNIVSGSSDQAIVVVRSGAIPAFIRLISSTNQNLQEQAAWAIGNIAGDSCQLRDEVLSTTGALEALLKCLSNAQKIAILRNATWALSNLCRGKPSPPFNTLLPALPVLARLIYAHDDEVLTDACWALSYLSDGSNDRLDAIVQVSGLVSRVVELLDHKVARIIAPTLRFVGNILTGDEKHTQAVLNCPKALPSLRKLLMNPKRSIRKEAVWGISNITAGSSQQIQAVIDANIFPLVIDMLKSSEFEIRKEASWAVSNATSGGSLEQVLYLVQQNVIPLFCDQLRHHDNGFVSVCLEGLENILRCGGNSDRFGLSNPFVKLVEECGGDDTLNWLTNHENPALVEKVTAILEFFGSEDDNEQDDPDDLHQRANNNNLARINNLG